MSTVKLSIVIPCYNEADNIQLLLNNICNTYKQYTEIILVDNGSTDNTADILENELELIKNVLIKFVKIEKNIGYGHGIMAGIKKARGDIISWTHADFQTDIKDVYNGFELFSQQTIQKKIFLKGIRNKRPIVDAILTLGMGIISSIWLRQNLNDINAQPKMFHRSFLKKIGNPPDDFSLDLYFYYNAIINEMKILELPVYFGKRLHGEAKGGGGSSIFTRIRVIFRTLRYILKLRKTIL